jgi:hypothetical protein
LVGIRESVHRRLTPWAAAGLCLEERVDRGLLARLRDEVGGTKTRSSNHFSTRLHRPGAVIAASPAAPMSALLQPPQAPPAQSAVRDVDLVASMARRLAALEAELAAARVEARQLQQENRRLQQVSGMGAVPSDAEQRQPRILVAPSKSAATPARRSTQALPAAGAGSALAPDAAPSAAAQPPPAPPSPRPATAAPQQRPAAPPAPPSPRPATAGPQQRPAAPSALPRWQVQAQQLEAENARLRNQCRRAWRVVEQLRGFLAEYGLVWVGEAAREGEAGEGQAAGQELELEAGQERPVALARLQVQQPAEQQAASSSSSSSSNSSSSPAAAAGRLPFDLERLRRQLLELSALAGGGASRLVPLHGPPARPGSPPGPYALQRAPEVRLWVFADGLQLHSCPPQPYSSPAAQAVIADILEGYYPAALRADFPDGVAIQLVDRTSEPMAAAGSGGAAAGGPPGPLPPQQLLQRLPAAVIRGGRVVSVRAGVAELLSGPAGAAPGAGRREVLACGGGGGGGEGGGSEAGGEGGAGGASLQVKDEAGAHTYVLAMRGSDTIGELRRRLDAHRAAAAASAGGGGGAPGRPGYEIRSAFPARVYGDDSVTLQQAGLVPSATLFLRAVAAS